MNETTKSIMARLKESTRELHDEAEHCTFNVTLVKGRLPREAYVESLCQLYLIHQALDDSLFLLRDEWLSIARVVQDYHRQTPYLEADLAHLGCDPYRIQPLPATRRFLERMDHIARSSPIAILGVHYVFEGSHNGTRFIARAVRRAYLLNDGDGTRYLDPYGDRQTIYWQAFKDQMNTLSLTSEVSDAIVCAAVTTFEGIIDLYRELWAAHQTAEATGQAV
jgi:heme oxygenase